MRVLRFRRILLGLGPGRIAWTPLFYPARLDKHELGGQRWDLNPRPPGPHQGMHTPGYVDSRALYPLSYAAHSLLNLLLLKVSRADLYSALEQCVIGHFLNPAFRVQFP